MYEQRQGALGGANMAMAQQAQQKLSSAPRERSAIDDEMSALHQMLSTLQLTADQLADRLVPVRSMMPASNGCQETAPPPPRSQLCSEIRDAGMKAQQTAALLRILLDELTL